MYRRVFVVAGLLAVTAWAGLRAAEEAPKSIKAVMANHKQGQLRAQVTEAVKKDTVDWDEVQKKTKSYAENAAALAKFDPPLGDKEAYKKKATAFAETIKDLDKAAQAKDAKAAQAALTKSGGMCMGCHSEHRPKP